MKKSVDHVNQILGIEKKIIKWNNDEKIDCRLAVYGNVIKDLEIRLKASVQEKFKRRRMFVFDLCVLLCDILEVSGGKHSFAFFIAIILPAYFYYSF